jgi:hypothetical protein
MLVGIYNSAVLVSANTNLRKTIHKHALESKLLNLIGEAEFERWIQRTVRKIIEETPTWKGLPKQSTNWMKKN